MPKADGEIAHGALTRIVEACRKREVADADSGVRVTDHQARILLQLDDQDPAMVGELAEFLGVTASTMSLNLKRLEAAGCVRRSRDPDDRRVMNVRLTGVGQRIRERASLLDPVRIDAALQSLRPDERETALAGLALLADGADRVVARGDAYLQALTGGGPE